jgi:hypothetical protein
MSTSAVPRASWAVRHEHDSARPEHDWAARRSMACEAFLGRIRADLADLRTRIAAGHLEVERSRHDHPAGWARPSAGDHLPQPAATPTLLTLVSPIETASSALPPDDIRTVHVYDSLTRSNPRRLSDKKIARRIERWGRRGYQLSAISDNRGGASGVLRATLVFTRVPAARPAPA